MLRRAARRAGRQEGQALVAVLVILTLVFGIAGALVTVASALLTQERNAQPTLSAELTAASAINGALAQVADRGVSSPPRSGPASSCLPSGLPAISTLRAVLGLQPAVCLRVDNVSTAAGDLVPFTPASSGSGCSLTRIPAPTDHNIRVLVWFVMRSGGPSSAWVTAASGSCLDNGGQLCAVSSSGSVNGIFGSSFDCDRSTWPDGELYLHVVSRDPMPRLAWWAKYAQLDNTYRTASVYALAIPTGMPAANVEEAHVLVPSDARPDEPLGSDMPSLLWRAPLP